MFSLSQYKRILSVVIMFTFIFTLSAFAKVYQIGIILDGQNNKTKSVISTIKGETKKMLGDDFDIVFPEKLILDGKWNKNTIQNSITRLENDKRTDIVLCLGAVGSQLLGHLKVIKKPSFALRILNAKMQKIPYKSGISGIKNLNYIDLDINIKEHITKFREIANFNELSVLMSACFIESTPNVVKEIKTIGKELGIRINIIPVSEYNNLLIKSLKHSKAILMAQLPRFSEEDIKNLVNKLAEMKIPTMDMIGRKSVELGALTSVYSSIDTHKIARRIALNIQRTFMGENPSSFNVDFSQPDRLVINMKTARKIRIYPTWSQMTDAEIINEENTEAKRKLTLREVINKAVARNLQLAAKRYEIKASTQTIQRAKSALRPKLSGFMQETVIDKDRADNMVSPAEYSAQIGANLMHVLYNEQAKANIDIKKLMKAAKKEEERALILDVIRDAALAYLNVLKVKTLQAIQRDNLEVTRANLEIAKFRKQVGMSGPAEVYRWEILMTDAKQAIIDASVSRRKAELMLNQLLNSKQEDEFQIADKNIYNKIFAIDTKQLAPYINNMHNFKIFRDFMVKDTLSLSPEVQQMNKGILAQKRGLKSSKRRYIEPTVALQGNFSRTFHEAGKGRVKPTFPPPFGSAFSIPDKNDWYVGLNVSVPLHEGGDRKAAVKEAKANLQKLETKLELLKQKLELNTRVNLENARSSFSSIALSEERADYASKTLTLVQRAYSRGAVNILDLIDAQNAHLIAKEAATNSIFNFLSDFVKISRAVGTFDFIIKQDSQKQWLERLKKYYSKNKK